MSNEYKGDDRSTYRHGPLTEALQRRNPYTPHRGDHWARKRLIMEGSVCFHKGTVTYGTTGADQCPECIAVRLDRP